MPGTLSVLNVGDGDTKLSFDPKNPIECVRAARIVKDMLRRGYALMVQLPDGSYQRALAFDEKHYEYIIADFDPLEAAAQDEQEIRNGNEQGSTSAGAAPAAAATSTKRGPYKKRGLPAGSTNATAVAPISGG